MHIFLIKINENTNMLSKKVKLVMNFFKYLLVLQLFYREIYISKKKKNVDTEKDFAERFNCKWNLYQSRNLMFYFLRHWYDSNTELLKSNISIESKFMRKRSDI